jgi:adenylosuccinate lyase
VKLEGGANDLLERLLADPAFHLTQADLDQVLDVNKFVGLAPQQTETFLNTYVSPILEKYADDLGIQATTNV